MREVRMESNHHGAGLYGRETSTASRCRRGNSPYPHNPECNCQDERPNQTVPYFDDGHVPDIEQEIEAYREREQARVDAEIDRQQGYRF